MVIAAFSLWDLMVGVFWFFVLFAWIWLVITIYIDIFRDKELSGAAKAGWVIFVLALPWLGVLVYLIARGDKMNENRMNAAVERTEMYRQYAQQVAPAGGGAPSTADELEKLGKLLDDGKISQDEFATLKAKLLG